MIEDNKISTEKSMETGIKVALGCGCLVIILILCVVIFLVIGLISASKTETSIEKPDNVKTQSDNVSKKNVPKDSNKESNKINIKKEKKTFKSPTIINTEDDLWNNPSKMNESVDVKGVAWTIISAKNMGSKIRATSKYGDDCLANSGKFIYVKIKIKNNTNKMQSTIGTSIYDSKKRKFENSSEVYGCVDNQLFILDNMNPGIEKTFVQVFEVPKDASGFKIEVTDLDFLNNAHKYVTLGI